MLATLGFIAAANSPNLITYSQNYGWYSSCVVNNQAVAASNIISILLLAYIPFTLMLIFDVIVFKRIRKSRQRVGVTVTQMGQRKQPGQISNKEYNFIVSTIFIDLTFVIFYTPISAQVTYTVISLYVKWDSLTVAAFNILYSCGLLLFYLYSVLLFWIFFAFNRYFRNEVFYVLRLNRLFSRLNQTTTLEN
jgi:hypothetical protein